MQIPYHWSYRTLLSWFWLPAAMVYWLIVCIRSGRIKAHKLSVPVICVGNNVVGGAGKTPVAIAVAQQLKKQGYNPHFISRGYKGNYDGTVRVDPALHIAVEVGDEPLLLARYAPCWVAKRRLHAANAAIADGADVIIMDDGMQNPSIHKDVTILVVDGTFGFGSRFMIPAGPCREPVTLSIQKASAVVIMGELKNAQIKCFVPQDMPVFQGSLQPDESVDVKGKKLHPFAGIGHPQKFFDMLTDMGAHIDISTRFDDHHIFTQKDTDRLLKESVEHNAQLVTTRKDYVRLEDDFKQYVVAIDVSLQLSNEFLFAQLLQQTMSNTKEKAS